MPRRVPDISKVKALIGFQPKLELDDIIKSVIEYTGELRLPGGYVAASLGQPQLPRYPITQLPRYNVPMRSRFIVAALVVLLGASSASAQVLSLEFHDGRVRLTAENVPVSRILDEWARLGGTKIVNGERVPGAPVTLQLTDVPERQALDTVLRGAAGYMVLARDTVTPAPQRSTRFSSSRQRRVLPRQRRPRPRAPAAAIPESTRHGRRSR